MQARPNGKGRLLNAITNVDVIEEALSAGAAGYVLEREAKHVLLPPLATILKGNRFVSDGLSRNGSAEA
jgi:DNA-binding NarL/FixJ family response regulator